MKGFEGYKYHAVQQRLNLVINSIVERHRTAGQVLTWKLLHEIEKEALTTLRKAGDLDASYVRMMRFSRWGFVPKTDDPADLENSCELPVAASMIYDAYRLSH
jgi:hypothetical protein